MRFLDRDGKVYNSLEEAMVRYKGVENIRLTSAVVFENIYPKFLAAGTATLAIEVQGVNISEKK